MTYGFASATKKIAMSGQAATDTLRVAAGALKLSGAIGDTRIAPAQLSFSVFVPIGTNSEGRLVRSGVKAGELLRLPEGTYHVVSTYGESNAIQRADLKVENGKVTDATLNHRAATVTLKLVTSPGAEAFAGTAFSVLTPGGDTIREAIGAFPTGHPGGGRLRADRPVTTGRSTPASSRSRAGSTATSRCWPRRGERASRRAQAFTTSVKSDHCSTRNARMSRTEGANQGNDFRTMIAVNRTAMSSIRLT